MSYDLMVFEPDAAPKERDAFLAWFEGVAKWDEGHNYDDPAFTAPRLQAWYREMIERFPAMNGPDALADDDPAFDSPMVTGYCCASAAIYMDFRWNVASEAYNHVLTLAAKHQVGLYDVSANDGAVWLPAPGGGYEVAHGGGPGEHDTVNAVSEMFRSGRIEEPGGVDALHDKFEIKAHIVRFPERIETSSDTDDGEVD